MGLADGIAQGALSGAVIEVRTALAPPFRVSLDPSQSSGGLVPLLQPAITVRSQGVELMRVAPYGEPGDGWKITLAVAAALVLVALLLVGVLA